MKDKVVVVIVIKFVWYFLGDNCFNKDWDEGVIIFWVKLDKMLGINNS